MLKSFLRSKAGSVVNVALYMAAAAAITSVVDYTAGLDMSGQPILYTTIVQVVNLVLVGIRQAYFKK